MHPTHDTGRPSLSHAAETSSATVSVGDSTHTKATAECLPSVSTEDCSNSVRPGQARGVNRQAKPRSQLIRSDIKLYESSYNLCVS